MSFGRLSKSENVPDPLPGCEDKGGPLLVLRTRQRTPAIGKPDMVICRKDLLHGSALEVSK